MANFVLALDVGTSSVRAAHFDDRLRRRSFVQRSYRLRYTPDGGAELDPQRLLAAARYCLQSALDPRRRSPVAAAVACFWHSLLGTDRQGRPLTPVYTWADARCREDAARLRAELDEHRIHARTGCMLRASFWPAKLRWLRRTQPALFHRVDRWLSPGEWLQWRITGQSPRCSSSMASGTGLHRLRGADWDDDLLDRCRVRRSQLSPVSDEPELSAGVRWCPAIGDGAASSFGTVGSRPGLATVNFGTSAAVRIIGHGRPPVPPFGLFCYRLDSQRYLVGGAVSAAGNLHDWALNTLAVPRSSRSLERALAARSLPRHGLTVLPFWVHDRAPHWREDLHGAVLGITQSTTPLDIYQALRESAFYRLAMIADRLETHRRRRCRYVISGGLLGSPSGLQRLANVLNRPLAVSRHQDASLRGAAMVAWENLGRQVQAAEPGPIIKPRPAVARVYATERRRHERAEGSLGDALGCPSGTR